MRAPGSGTAGLAAAVLALTPPPRPRLPLAAFPSVNNLSEVASLLGLARDCLGPPLYVVPEARKIMESAPHYRAF